MHHLPPSTSPINEMFSIESDLVPIGTGERQPALFRDALNGAVATIARNKAIQSVVCMALRANDDLVLLKVGERGGHRCIWNFTTGKRSY